MDYRSSNAATRHNRDGSILIRRAKRLGDAYLINISKSGLLVRSTVPFKPGSKVALHMPHNNYHNERFVGEVVRSAHYKADDQYRVGIRLLNTTKQQSLAISAMIQNLPVRKSRISGTVKLAFLLVLGIIGASTFHFFL